MYIFDRIHEIGSRLWSRFLGSAVHAQDKIIHLLLKTQFSGKLGRLLDLSGRRILMASLPK